MSKPLTDALVRTAKPPERGQSLITDSTLRNFALRLSQGGAKTFVVSLGRGKRHTIGHYPTITLSEARTAAKRILAERELGKITPERVPFDDAAADFLRDCKTRVRPRTLKNYTDYLRMLPFNRRPVASITPREIVVILNNQVPSQRRAITPCRPQFLQMVHPAAHPRPLAAQRPASAHRKAQSACPDRRRAARAVWRSARSLATPHHAIVALLVLTGQRRGEIARLEWDWVKGDRIEFPASIAKNHRAWSIPIGPVCQDHITRISKMVGSPYVFPASRQRKATTTTFNGWSKAKAEFDKESGVTGYTLHDLRRTYSTSHAQLGTLQVVVEKLLNHVSGGTLSPIAAVYNVHRYEAEMREAVLKYERWLATL